jgi:hypothetical protein
MRPDVSAETSGAIAYGVIDVWAGPKHGCIRTGQPNVKTSPRSERVSTGGFLSLCTRRQVSGSNPLTGYQIR